jgi:hypothetical protein
LVPLESTATEKQTTSVTAAVTTDASQPPIANGHAPAPTAALSEVPTQAKQTKEQFLAAALRFVVHNAAYDACTRAEDLKQNSEALKVIVNTHFQVERVKLAATNNKKKRSEKPETAFSEPLIVFSALNAAGFWSKARKLSLAAKGNDLDLIDRESLESAKRMAALGVMGFVLIVDALERTTKKYIARVALLIKVDYRDVPDVFNIVDFKARINALTSITRLQIYGSQITIEDVYYKMMLVNVIEQTVAVEDKTKRQVESSMTDDDDNPEILVLKKTKLLSEADLNGTLDDLRKEANSFQIHELAKNSQDLLIIALTDYKSILERVESNVVKGVDYPMLVSMTTRSSRVDTSEYPVSYCSTKEVQNMILEKEANLEPVPERLKNIIAQANDPKHKSIGANAIILEVIDIGTGLMVGLEAYNICYVPDVLALKPKIEAQRVALAKIKEDRTARQREVDAPPPRLYESDAAATVEETIKKVIDTCDERKKESHVEWATYKKKLQEEFDAKLAALEKKHFGEKVAESASSSSTSSEAPAAPAAEPSAPNAAATNSSSSSTTPTIVEEKK